MNHHENVKKLNHGHEKRATMAKTMNCYEHVKTCQKHEPPWPWTTWTAMTMENMNHHEHEGNNMDMIYSMNMWTSLKTWKPHEPPCTWKHHEPVQKPTPPWTWKNRNTWIWTTTRMLTYEPPGRVKTWTTMTNNKTMTNYTHVKQKTANDMFKTHEPPWPWKPWPTMTMENMNLLEHGQTPAYMIWSMNM